MSAPKPRRSAKIIPIWEVERCSSDGCGRIALYRFFSNGFEFSHSVCIEHFWECRCPFEIHGVVAICNLRPKRRIRRYARVVLKSSN